jgi:hypothetical protein
MSNRFLTYILVEDKRHQALIRALLKRAGVGPREMIFAPIPGGRGSGKQSVLYQFSDQVKACRRRNSYATTSLIVVMDADELSVEFCLNNLDGRLIGSGQDRVNSKQDRVARLIPKRNIETWILFLSCSGAATPPLNEDEPYKHTKSEEQWMQLIPEAAKTLWAWTGNAAIRPENLLDSLRRGIDEIPRALPQR